VAGQDLPRLTPPPPARPPDSVRPRTERIAPKETTSTSSSTRHRRTSTSDTARTWPNRSRLRAASRPYCATCAKRSRAAAQTRGHGAQAGGSVRSQVGAGWCTTRTRTGVGVRAEEGGWGRGEAGTGGEHRLLRDGGRIVRRMLSQPQQVCDAAHAAAIERAHANLHAFGRR
jgi:hypothetical protein